MDRPWIGTSWKMNKVRAEACAYAERLRDMPAGLRSGAQLFVVPPFPYIADVAGILRGSDIMVGAQNVHWDDHGAWTGEVSAPMVKDCGGMFVEIGHSERRHHFAETNATVALKVEAALRNGLRALVCIGESASAHAAGQAKSMLARQVAAALSRIPREAAHDVIFAYEPYWSIGERGTPADPAYADEHHRHVKAVCERLTGRRLPVLYGGSIDLTNARAYVLQENVDGLFIGRYALDPAHFIAVVSSCVSPGH